MVGGRYEADAGELRGRRGADREHVGAGEIDVVRIRPRGGERVDRGRALLVHERIATARVERVRVEAGFEQRAHRVLADGEVKERRAVRPTWLTHLVRRARLPEERVLVPVAPVAPRSARDTGSDERADGLGAVEGEGDRGRIQSIGGDDEPPSKLPDGILGVTGTAQAAGEERYPVGARFCGPERRDAGEVGQHVLHGGLVALPVAEP